MRVLDDLSCAVESGASEDFHREGVGDSGAVLNPARREIRTNLCALRSSSYPTRVGPRLDLYDDASTTREGHNSDMALIEASGLSKHYGPVKALEKLDLSVEPGIIGLVGANGAGKSTLIKILLGLLTPTAGRAKVLGMDCVTEAHSIRQFVGYMPEHDCLPPDVTATEFVTHMARISGLPRSAARERTAEVLRHVGLYEERYRQIGGYSTGMKQRVKLAQALVHDPKVLLLDEPTNGLDPTGRDDMLDLVKRTGTDFGITVVVASHLLGEIEQVCTYLLAIEAGHLLRSAPITHFTQRTPVLSVEVEEGSDRLVAALAKAGAKSRIDGARVLIALDNEALYDTVRDSVADLSLALVRIQQERGRLEDLFRGEAPREVVQ
jgi:ABC-2 type transport system ATP-binding protein